MKLRNDTDLAAWLKLSCLPGIGGVKMNKLLSKDTPSNIVGYSTEQLQLLGFTTKQLQAWSEVDKEVDACLTWLAPHLIIILLLWRILCIPHFSNKRSLHLLYYL